MNWRGLLPATALIVAVQVTCAAIVLHQMSRPSSADEIFADHVQQMSYDGAVIRVDFGRGRIASNRESPLPGATQDLTVARVVITADGAEQLYQNLAKLRATAHARGPAL